MLDRSGLIAKTWSSLADEWERWRVTLPPEAIYWPPAAAYVRESGVDSMVGDAAVLQLRATLEMLSREQMYVPWDLVYFENATGTEIAARAQFQRLLARAESGEFKAIGCYLSGRSLRNVEDAIAVKRQMRRRGVKLLWVGKPDIDAKDPVAFLLERNLEVADEWVPRQVSYLVSRAKEQASLRGVPIGKLPEIWRVTSRGQSTRQGRPGPPTASALVEPIASVVKEGALRYLAGHSFQDLATWSAGSAIEGLTPHGRPTDRNLVAVEPTEPEARWASIPDGQHRLQAWH